jgi:hypothetical protein
MAFPLAGAMTTPVIFPSGSSTPSTAYSGSFIPEIWSGKLIEKFYASTVLTAISNTDYEGEIKSYGDKVKIRQKPTITISTYRADGQLAVQRPSAAVVELLIDQGKYFNCLLDDVMEHQSDINMMSMWSDDAGEQMKIQIDSDVLLGMIDQATATYNRGIAAGKISGNINLGATTTPVTLVPRSPASGEVEIIDFILRMGQVLDEQNIPESGRYVVLPTWAATQVKRSELRDASLSGDGSSILRNGRLGMIDRFTLYASNLLPNGVAGGLAAGEFAMFAGHAHALTFASQMTNMEQMRSEFTFGEYVRGLQVFGFKVLDGQALVQGIVIQ